MSKLKSFFIASAYLFAILVVIELFIILNSLYGDDLDDDETIYQCPTQLFTIGNINIQDDENQPPAAH